MPRLTMPTCGEHFNALVAFVLDYYDRHTMDEAIAAVPSALVTEGPLLWGRRNSLRPSCGPSVTQTYATWSSHSSQSGLQTRGPLWPLGYREDRQVTS